MSYDETLSGTRKIPVVGMWFNKDAFHAMFAVGWIVDGRGGGLLLGRSHAGGNIYTLRQLRDGSFDCPCHVEGGEYIINRAAYLAFEKRIHEINEFNDGHDLTSCICISPKSRILNTHSEPYDKFLFLEEGQYIVNKNATAKYFDELEEINHDGNDMLSCNLDSLAPGD
jgi:hypothetical protein